MMSIAWVATLSLLGLFVLIAGALHGNKADLDRMKAQDILRRKAKK